MNNFFKNLLYKQDKNQGIQYKEIETSINNIFKGEEENVNAQTPKKLIPSKNLERNKKYIQTVFTKCDDIIYREINIMSDNKYNAVCIYIKNMISSQIAENIINKLSSPPSNYQHINNIKEYCKSTTGIDESDEIEDLNQIVDAITEGEMILIINGIDRGYSIDIKSPPSRSIEQPVSESVTRGPKEGFIEDHFINISLIRKKIKSPNLKVEGLKVGRQTNTNLSIVYMENIANKSIVDEVRNRIKQIDIDSVLASSYIEEYIEDSPFSIFPTIFRTEKPDVVCGKLLEGRVAIFINTEPVVLIVPTLFIEFFMSPEDYYLRFYAATLSRIIRFLSFILSLILPAAFVSLVTFHHELLPTALIINIIRARASIPFSPMFEASFMLTTYLVLQEADLRMPKTMGQAVSVVGGLVLGQAAISAGIVSTHMIIVVAFSAVCALALPTPELQMPLSYIRFALLMLGGFAGMVGLTCGLIFIAIHLLSLESFGVPYFSPLSPLKPQELMYDTFIRFPIWTMKKRPKTIIGKDSIRRKGKVKTKPITEDEKDKCS
ncbi:spore germination protein [Clostridium prolinivorans]|jgi:spore germination protein KA|uniref:spore germination protein n=1 Tax=Clostridium prolinivorans TaxID=2769420 RepID=UPI000FDB0130|nr:spore germination protein [Clostridium prolinivorans]